MPQASKALQNIERLLSDSQVEYDFFYEDFQTQKEFHLGKSKKYPFASCFKVAVLGSVLDIPGTYEKLNDQIVIDKADLIPFATGVTSRLDLPVSLSMSNLLNLMMKYSDGAATDKLITIAGMEQVIGYVQHNTENSKVTNNIGSLLSTIVDAAKQIAGPNPISRAVYLQAIQETVAKTDYTNARDLTLLLRKVADSGQLHRRFLFQEQDNPRSNSYSPAGIQIFGKTGTLGFWSAVNDCGIIVKSDVPVGVFGLVTTGWKLPRHLIEHTFGMVGRELGTIYSESSTAMTFG